MLFTVDAVFRALTLRRFLAGAASLPFAEGVLALTRFCDDEKPLRVEIDRDHKIRRIGETGDIGHRVTAGFYRFEPSVFDFAENGAGERVVWPFGSSSVFPLKPVTGYMGFGCKDN